MVCEIRGKEPYSYCFLGCCFLDLFKTAHDILVQFPSSFSSTRFDRLHGVQPFSSTNTAKAWNNFCFIISTRSDSHVIDNLSGTAPTFPMCMLTSLSVYEILLPRYVSRCSIFRSLPFSVKMLPTCLKQIIT